MNKRFSSTAICALSLFMISLEHVANPRQSPVKRGPVAGQSSQAKFEFIRGSVTVAGIERTYTVHLPRGYQSSHPLALVFNFHGEGGSGEGVADSTGLNAFADTYGFIVVYPDGMDHHWTGDIPKPGQPDTLNDLLFVRALIDRIEKLYSINPDRIIATGFSNGGAFAQQLACRHGSPFSGVVSVSGVLNRADAAACAPDRPVFVIQIHGTSDPLVPYEGGEVNLKDGGHFSVISIEESVELWARLGRCQTPPKTTPMPERKNDGTKVERTIYSPCQRDSGVVHYRVIGGGHTWPGSSPTTPNQAMGRVSQQIKASEIIGEMAGNVRPMRPEEH
jgi:polyhydroxybutyrate depolymerase